MTWLSASALQPSDVNAAAGTLLIAGALQLVHVYVGGSLGTGSAMLMANIHVYGTFLAIYLVCAGLLVMRQGWVRWLLAIFWGFQVVEMFNAKWQLHDGLQLAAITMGMVSLALALTAQANTWFRKEPA